MHDTQQLVMIPDLKSVLAKPKKVNRQQLISKNIFFITYLFNFQCNI
jgi:hypothetical protein